MEFHERGLDLSTVDFRSVNQRQQFDDRLKMDFHWSWQSLVASARKVQVLSILNIKISVPNFLFIRIFLYKKTRLYKFCKVPKNIFLFSLLGHALQAKEMKRIPTKLLLPFLDFAEDAFFHHSNCTDFRFAGLAFSEIRRFS